MKKLLIIFTIFLLTGCSAAKIINLKRKEISKAEKNYKNKEYVQSVKTLCKILEEKPKNGGAILSLNEKLENIVEEYNLLSNQAKMNKKYHEASIYLERILEINSFVTELLEETKEKILYKPEDSGVFTIKIIECLNDRIEQIGNTNLREDLKELSVIYEKLFTYEAKEDYSSLKEEYTKKAEKRVLLLPAKSFEKYEIKVNELFDSTNTMKIKELDKEAKFLKFFTQEQEEILDFDLGGIAKQYKGKYDYIILIDIIDAEISKKQHEIKDVEELYSNNGLEIKYKEYFHERFAYSSLILVYELVDLKDFNKLEKEEIKHEEKFSRKWNTYSLIRPLGYKNEKEPRFPTKQEMLKTNSTKIGDIFIERIKEYSKKDNMIKFELEEYNQRLRRIEAENIKNSYKITNEAPTMKVKIEN